MKHPVPIRWCRSGNPIRPGHALHPVSAGSAGIAAFLAAVLAASIHAAPPEIPPPTDPVITPLPARISWREEITSPSPVREGAPVVTHVDIARSGNRMLAVTAFSDGRRADRWYWDGLLCVDLPNAGDGQVAVNSLGSEGLPSAFPDLRWITAATHVGSRTEKGRAVWDFDASRLGPRTSEDGETIPPPAPGTVTATVDARTGRPVLFKNGGTTIAYVFETDFRLPAQLPERFQRQIAEVQRIDEILSRRVR